MQILTVLFLIASFFYLTASRRENDITRKFAVDLGEKRNELRLKFDEEVRGEDLSDADYQRRLLKFLKSK